MAVRAVFVGKVVAIQPCIDSDGADLVDDSKSANADANARVVGDRFQRTAHGQFCGHRSIAASADHPASVEEQHPRTRLVKGELHGRKSSGRKVDRAATLCGNVPQIEWQ